MFEKRGDSFTVSYSKLQNSRPKRRGGQSAQGKAEDAGGLAPVKDDNAAIRTLYPRSFAGYSDDCYRYAGYNSGSLSAGPYPSNYIRFQLAPSLVSVTSIPWAFSSSRMRSASAKFFAFFASAR